MLNPKVKFLKDLISENCLLKIFSKILVLEASEPLSFSLPETRAFRKSDPQIGIIRQATPSKNDFFSIFLATKMSSNFLFQKSSKNVPKSTILDPKIVPKSNFFRLLFESVDFSKSVLSSRRELNFQGSEPPKNDSKSMPKSRSKTSSKKTSQKSIFGSSWTILSLQVGAKLAQKLPNSQQGSPPRNFLS